MWLFMNVIVVYEDGWFVCMLGVMFDVIEWKCVE